MNAIYCKYSLQITSSINVLKQHFISISHKVFAYTVSLLSHNKPNINDYVIK